jgi:hypothetical protein
MALPLKRYELIVTQVLERRIYVTAVGPAEAMFEAGRRLEQFAGAEKDRYLKLREVPEEEWDS